MTQRLFLLISIGCLASACGDIDGGADTADSGSAVSGVVTLTVQPAATTAPLANGGYVNAAFLPSAAGGSFIVGAAGVGGLEVHRSDGSRAGGAEDIEAGMVVSVPATEGRAAFLVAYDSLSSTLRGYSLSEDGSSFDAVIPDPVPIADEVVGLCHYRSALSSSDFIYAVTDAGMILHYELYGEEGDIAARLLRSVPSSKGSGFCVADPRDGALYVAEESTGIWRFDAEAETDTERGPVDLREPFGNLSDDIKGIALQPVDAESAYLLIADVGYERVSIYRMPDGEIEGHVSIEGLVEPEGMSIGPTGNAASTIVIADESLDGGGSDMKFVEWASVASALSLKAEVEPIASAPPIVVRPVVETDVIPTYGDSADDPAIWVDPDDAAQSVVIGTGKKSGLYVFDLEGNTLQEVADGRMNNVDLRDGFELDGEPVPIVTASNRSNDSIAVYRLDTASKRLIDIADGILDTGFGDPYGLCMYRSPSSGDFFVFVNEGGSGLTRQWRLIANDNGRVGIERVREIEVGSQAEGCVADDVNETLYVAEEGVGLWKYSAEPNGGNERTAIDSTDESGRLTADVEGVALYARDDGTGYLVASNQGADNFAVYRREGDNEFLGIFHVVANAEAGIDGASETDGLEVSSAALGSRFPDGLLVVQDGRNIAPEERQNFKYVSWTDIAAALDID